MKKPQKPIERKHGKNGTYLNLYPKYQYDPTEYERPTYTVDMCIFRICKGDLQILLIERAQAPFKGKLAFPGGFVNIKDGESSEDAAVRELEEETGVKDLLGSPTQFKTYSRHDRDPRWHTVDTVYFYLMREEEWERMPVQAGDDAAKVCWHSAWSLQQAGVKIMGFDHHMILCDLLHHFSSSAWRESLFFYMTPRKDFTVSELREAFLALTGKMHVSVDPGNFSKAIRKRYVLEELSEKKQPGGAGRPASAYKWVSDKHDFQE